jgi:hypothetical protein
MNVSLLPILACDTTPSQQHEKARGGSQQRVARGPDPVLHPYVPRDSTLTALPMARTEGR